MGDYTIAANDLIAECTSKEMIADLENVMKDANALPDRKKIADNVMVKCESYFSLLESSLTKDGKDAELAARVANDARVETKKNLILTISFD
tara:strand:+ start:438 stop:713 length:276 start_codon:yes stop_codon:yes gene_type:complete